jgi:hypothetical protein
MDHLLHGWISRGRNHYLDSGWCVCMRLACIYIDVDATAVRGVWGYDVIGQECWVAIQGAEERFAWQVGSAYAWTIRELHRCLFVTAC